MALTLHICEFVLGLVSHADELAIAGEYHNMVRA